MGCIRLEVYSIYSYIYRRSHRACVVAVVILSAPFCREGITRGASVGFAGAGDGWLDEDCGRGRGRGELHEVPGTAQVTSRLMQDILVLSEVALM